ncbi:MAG TPA: hypothetical protein DET40_10025 [Lentisphaeria bacterium]|nr:MAG: hypothetical protein A2X45_08810 [Lentisphaerae bacterium GWF2_50_93]HCE43873.1 hypothetical protein [Lentisphaeria bacterium]
MNYLAHAFLSGDDPEMLIGNMAADSLKGRLPSTLQFDVIRGVRLHRRIDHLADKSEEFSSCMTVFRPKYGRYAHVLVDIAFDHLLAWNWDKYSRKNFHGFVQHVYKVLRTRRDILPHAFIPVADRILGEDWLTCYESLEGLAISYERLGRRIDVEKGHLEKAVDMIEQNRDFLNGHFNSLFPKLVKLSQSFCADEKAL